MIHIVEVGTDPSSIFRARFNGLTFKANGALVQQLFAIQLLPSPQSSTCI